MKNYTDKETITVIQNYRKHGISGCKDILSSRSSKSVYTKASRLGIKRVPNWSDRDLKILMSVDIEEASAKLNRTINACRIKKHRINNYGK